MLHLKKLDCQARLHRGKREFKILKHFVSILQCDGKLLTHIFREFPLWMKPGRDT